MSGMEDTKKRLMKQVERKKKKSMMIKKGEQEVESQ